MRYAKKYLECEYAEPEKSEQLRAYLDDMESKIAQMTEEERRIFLKEPIRISGGIGGKKWIIPICLIIIAVIAVAVYFGTVNDDQPFDGYQNEEYDNSESADEDIAYSPGSYDEYADDFILPGSDEKDVDNSEVEGLSKEDTQMAINEIYARHGRIFRDEPYASHFDACEWFVPTYSADEFDESWFNDYEKENVKLLAEHRSIISKNKDTGFSKKEIASADEAIDYVREYIKYYDLYEPDKIKITMEEHDEEGYHMWGWYDEGTHSTTMFRWTVEENGSIYDWETNDLIYGK